MKIKVIARVYPPIPLKCLVKVMESLRNCISEPLFVQNGKEGEMEIIIKLDDPK